MPAEPAQPAAAQQSVARAVAAYTALRLALMAVLSVLAWVVGLPWIPAIAAGVILATVVSLTVLRRSTRRLSAVLAAASARNRAARPLLAPGGPQAAGDPTDDLYDIDPYADDEDEATDPHDLAHQQGRQGRGQSPDQDARTSARPTSRP